MFAINYWSKKQCYIINYALVYSLVGSKCILLNDIECNDDGE